MNSTKLNPVAAFVCILIMTVSLGCQSRKQSNFKQQTDNEVYGIIDDKWEPQFGQKANYRTSDSTDDGPSRIELKDGPLSLSKVLAVAIAQNRQYQTEKDKLYDSVLKLTLVRHEFNPNLFAGGGFGYSDSGDESSMSGNIGVGLNRLLADGTRISTDVALAWADVLTGNARSGFSSIFSAVVTKPLLRGSARKFVLESLTQAEHDALYQIRTFNRFRKEFAVSTITGYYQVLEQQEKRKNAEDNYQRLKKVYQKLSTRAEVGKFPQHELDQAQQDLLQSKDILIREQKLSKQLLDEFKLFLAVDPTIELELDGAELEALTQAGMDGPKFSEQQAIETAVEQRLDLANSSDAIIDAQRKVELALDSIRAELNLVAGTEQSSKKIAGTGENSIGVGMELDLGIDRKVEKAKYRRALLALNQFKRDHAEALDSITVQVRKAYRDLKEAAQIYELQLENKKLAKHRFDNTTALLQYDRASTRDILDAQEDYFEAQDETTAALVDYAIAMLNFYRDAGVLDVKADGMWQIPDNSQSRTN